MKFELSGDKATLHLDFTENDRRTVAKLAAVMERAGWWRDVLEVRKKEIDKVLSRMRDELEAQRKVVANALAEMYRVRAAKDIVDSDPENSNAVISASDRDVVKLRWELDEQVARVVKLAGQIESMRGKDSKSIKDAMRLLTIDDRGMEKMYDTLQELKAQDAELEAKGIAKTDPRRKDPGAQMEALEKTLSDAFASIQKKLSVRAEVELRQVAELDKQYKEAAARQIQDKQRTIEYSAAKARYLNAKKIFEAMQLKYSQERVNMTIDSSTPRGP
jgi:hypothetical protein